MDNVEENIEILQKLFESGVFSHEELDAKMAELLNKTSENEPAEFNDLLDNGLITHEEYEALKAKKKNADGVAVVTSNATSRTDILESFMKRNAVYLAIIALLAVALAVLGTQFASKQLRINKLEKESLEQSKKALKYQELADKYEGVLEFYYIDTAVVISDGDNNYYHRLGCPDIPDGTNMWLKYSKDAESDGYKKCPTCIESDVERYIKENL